MVIVGILAALALPNFSTQTEKALDREAKATLALMRAAERIYRMEVGDNYYPRLSYWTTSDIGLINSNLKLSLPTAASPKWGYSIDNTSSTGVVKASRPTPAPGRIWTLTSSGASENPTCSGSCL